MRGKIVLSCPFFSRPSKDVWQSSRVCPEQVEAVREAAQQAKEAEERAQRVSDGGFADWDGGSTISIPAAFGGYEFPIFPSATDQQAKTAAAPESGACAEAAAHFHFQCFIA